MKTLMLFGACIALSGCAAATQEKVLTNLEGCTRIYKGAVQGGILGGGFIGSVDVNCSPKAVPPSEPRT